MVFSPLEFLWLTIAAGKQIFAPSISDLSQVRTLSLLSHKQFPAQPVQRCLCSHCYLAVSWEAAAAAFCVTPDNIERPLLPIIEKLGEGCYKIHRIKDKKDLPQYFLYLLFIFLQAGSLKQSKNEEYDPKAFHVQIPF